MRLPTPADINQPAISFIAGNKPSQGGNLRCASDSILTSCAINLTEHANPQKDN
jgi:hypothetical protein